MVGAQALTLRENTMAALTNDQILKALNNAAARQRQTDAQLQTVLAKYDELLHACENQPRSISQEIDSIQGRRIFYTLGQVQTFTIAQNGVRAAALPFLVSQDGPFIATHYPFAIWKPSAPDNATNKGQWSPVSSWPLPTQQRGAQQDGIDLSYEVNDSGSQRAFQNLPVGPIFSRPDLLSPLPVPTLFAPNTTIQFIPTYERIFFGAPQVPTTGGTLYVGFPGYKIVNM